MPYLILFHRLVLRPLRREPVRTALTIFAVALGVAVVLAIEMAGEAAAGSFRSSVESLTGEADFEVTGVGGIPPEVLTKLARIPQPLRLRPRIEDFAVVVQTRRTVPFIGVDVLSDRIAGEAATSSSSDEDINAFQREDVIWAGRELGWKPGQPVRLLINDREAEFTLRGLLPDRSGAAVVMDLAPATRVLGRDGSLDRILIETPQHKSLEEWEQVLRAELPSGVDLNRYGARTDENRRMLAAFRWNLRVLSYIALVVGAFLIYNTISVSVVRRRSEVGILRALGATRSKVLAAFLGESVFFGVAGAALGVIFGRVLAESAVKLVAATVDSLYVSSQPAPIELGWNMVLAGFAIATGLAIVSALAPAWEASQVGPVDAMARAGREHQVRMRTKRHLALSVLFALVAAMASRQPPVAGKPLFGYLAALFLIAAAAFAIPAMISGISSVASGALSRILGVEALLAMRSLSGSLRRTSVLVGALATAIAMTAAVGIMVGSFRQTVLLWMEDRLQADLYLRPAGPVSAGRHPTFAPDTALRLRSLPEVEAIDQFRAYEISYNGMPAILGGSDARVAGAYSRRAFLSGTGPAAIFDRLDREDDVVIVSEPFANKHGVKAGDTIPLRLGGQERKFQVLDVYFDYASERGYIIMDRKALLKVLPDPAASNISVYLKRGISIEAGRRAIESALSGRRVMLLSNRSLREEAIRTFDRTFAITYALEAVAVLVAIMGVAGALLALVIDRRREFGLLRFLGGATGQVRRLVLFEAGLLGLLGNLAGVVLGFVLSLLLIYVINKQSFGWTIQFHLPVAILLAALSLVYAATVLASLYPARVASRLNPIEVVHEE
jgi:putative ABC transport system permease protein